MTEKHFAPLPDDFTAHPAAAEDEVLRRWREQDTFGALQRARASAPSFVFWEGPPTANGRPGIHHVLARTIKDAVCRWQSMNGKRVVRKAGWDTHGLPVELEVEKKLGISGKPEIEKYGVAAFNAKCRESVWTYQKEWEQLSERTGYWLDYGDPYVTYSEEYVESVWALLTRFHQAGLVYRGKKVLPYCGRCGTGLSSHEMGQPGVYRDILDPSITVRFRLDSKPGEEPESFLAWTTTPWTLPSNVALAVHPEREYVLARVALPVAKGAEKGRAGYERVWLARERATAVLGKEGSDFEIVKREPGRSLADREYQGLFESVGAEAPDPGAWIPGNLLPRRVVLADYVTVEDGTGIVHQAPSYGVEDWSTAQLHKLAVPQAVGPEGKFVCDIATVKKGTFFKDADDALMEDLKERGLLFTKSRENHSYPHCWRCNTPLFYFAVPAWYIRTSSYKDRMVELNKAIRWVPPEVGEKRFGEWLENNVDWNISRDRYWGTPLPFWVCDEDEKHEVAIGSVADLRRLAGRLPDGFDNHKPLVDEVTFECEKCGGTMRRTKAVLDCWFDSGAMPYAQYHWPFGDGVAKVGDQFPADFIAEGLDQTRGWFYTLHAIGAFVTKLPEFRARPGFDLKTTPAYGTCVVNGLILDKEGVKMSKRLGNVVDPWKTIEEHGADAVRWYLLASGQPWLPKRFDPAGMVEVRRKFFGTLANSYKFLADYARIDGFDPRDTRIPVLAQRPPLDRWLVSRTQLLLEQVRERMGGYDLAGACNALEEFVLDDVSNWYIRRSRKRFWLAETGSDKLAAFATLHSALASVAQLCAPFAPFFSEMLWSRLEPARGSVHASIVPDVGETLLDQDLVGSMHIVKRVVVLGRALRERLAIKNRQPLRALHVRTPDERALRLLEREFARDLVLGELNIKSLGSLAADDGQLCTLKAKANFKVLGKRLGGRMKAVAAHIEALTTVKIAQLRQGVDLHLSIGDGVPVQIGPEDVLIHVETKADFEVETDGRYVVWFDTELDLELILEGLAREIVNRVNGLRKEVELAPEDRIHLQLSGSGPDVLTAIDRMASFIQAETLATTLVRAPVSMELPAARGFDLGEGRVLAVWLRRA